MNNLYIEDLNNAIVNSIGIKKLYGKSIFITGACGLIGHFIVDMIMYTNEKDNANITIIANSRNKDNLIANFEKYFESSNFKYYIGDINNEINYDGNVDYIINCASNTHPRQYALDPINTILTNIEGTNNVLKFATIKKAIVIFLSSIEIYGQNINNVGPFKENEMGYIDCNSLRAGYNEGKRAGEALCQAYKEKNNVEVVIARLPRVYGPTVKNDDSKVISQFINNALNKENIILKSEGNQFFSYLYVSDAVSGIITILTSGKNGEAYNLGNIESDIHLKDLAKIIAKYSGTNVIFDVPTETEKKGYSTATDARLDYSKISEQLGWKPKYSIDDGIKKTIEILHGI